MSGLRVRHGAVKAFCKEFRVLKKLKTKYNTVVLTKAIIMQYKQFLFGLNLI